MKNIRIKKIQTNGDQHHWRTLAITITVIQIYLIGKESIKRVTMDTDRRNQVKNQKPNRRIYQTVKVTMTVTIREEIKLEGTPVVTIGLKKPRNPRNTKEEIRDENKRINQDPLNLSIEENPRNTGDLDHVVDDNVYKHIIYINVLRSISIYTILFVSLFLIKLIFPYGLIFFSDKFPIVP